MNVAIVGAGIGGLTLGNALKQAGISFEIYEKDANVKMRHQGYALGMKDPGGITALKKFGLLEKAQAAGRPASGFTFVTDRGKILMSLNASDPTTSGYTLGVPRTKLRELLLSNLEGSEIKYGMTCTGYKSLQNKVTIVFENGSESDADLIVACDGVNSAVRRQMLGDSPHFLGLSALGSSVEMNLDHPLLRGNAFMMLGSGKSIFVQKFDKDDKTTWSLCFHTQEKELNGLDPQQRKKRAIKETEGWASPVSEMISKTPANEIVSRTYYDRHPLKSYRSGKVLLLGDAAHPMSPFQGQGANTAMLDALDLAECLQALPGTDLEMCLKNYDEKIRARSKPHVLRSRKYAYNFHSTNPISRGLRNLQYRFFNRLIQFAEKQKNRKVTASKQ